MVIKKVGKRELKVGVKSTRYTPLEDEMQLASMISMQFAGRSVGAYLLRKGSDNFKIKFAFDCIGIHNTLRDEEIDSIFAAVEGGLKDILPGESLTIHLGSFSVDSERQEELSDLYRQVKSTELRYLIMAERSRVRELRNLGIRKPKYLRLYCTYTVDPGSAGASDAIEKVLVRLEKGWKRFVGEYDEARFNQVDGILNSAYTDGFQIWEALLSNKMGLTVRAMTAAEMWQQLWEYFNETQIRKIPQLLVLDESGLREEVSSEWNPVTVLMESDFSIPVADRKWVHVKGKYVGVLTFLEKPGGWGDKYKQMLYLWQVISREAIADTEIVCEVARANQDIVKTQMQRVAKQAITAAEISTDHHSVDVMAAINLKRSVAAQESIYEGDVPLYIGVAFLLHRSTTSKLDDACRFFQSLFVSPAWVAREGEYPWKIWLQCLPVTWDNLMAVPFNRRKLYLSGEAPGLLPLVRTKPGDAKGFELISDDGGTPVRVDLYYQHKNLGLFGATRSGKSLLAGNVVTYGLAAGLPVVILDYPKPDGTSTFSDYAKFLKHEAAYFDITTEANNIFEIPNLKGLPSSLQKERMDDYIDFLLSALLSMVVGSRRGESTDAAFSDMVRSILGLALKAFFADVLIRDRYAAAYKAGLGTQDWQAMPTLADFIGYCSHERLRMDSIALDSKGAIERIKLRLRFWVESRVGKALAAPSTFKNDAQLLVFALRGLSNDEDAAQMALSAYSAALRRALASEASIFFIDEAPVLFEFDAISNLIGRLCANGAKSGIRVILSAQDPDTIAKSPAGAKIFQNLSTRLVGRIQPAAVDSFATILKYPREVIGRNAAESFFPKKTGMYSQWLIDDGGTFTFARFYPSLPLLAITANNPDEQKARQDAFTRQPDKIRAITELARMLAAN
ncbi:MAG: hypothetical protein EAZ94_24005 [Oscillatoriales cyanobacterium]|nr:MAG: hypothetical protein EAZ94_24005 [Oscillatoriales cyanobacterium]